MPDVHHLSSGLHKDEPGPTAAGALSSERGAALSAMLLVALPFLLFWPSTESLLARWQDTVHRTYTHGLLVIALSSWMLWRGRARWLLEPTKPYLPGAAVLLLFGFLWLVAHRAGLQIVHQALLPLIAFSAFVTCFGIAYARRAWVPVAYLYFAIPVWDAVNPLLQTTSVMAVRLLLQAVGIPAFFVGDTFQIPAGSFEIASGCSGLHFFIVALAIAVFYGEMNRDTWTMRFKLIALAGLLAMFTNWIRIFIIVVAGHLTQMQHYLVSGEHYSFGWFMFAGVMLAYFLIVRRWPLSNVPTPATLAGATGAETLRPGLLLAVGAMLPVVAYNVFDQNLAVRTRDALPADVMGWEAQQPAYEHWNPVFEGADIQQRLSYRSTSFTVDAYAASYLLQRQGKEVVGYHNSLLGAGLEQESRAQATRREWTELRARDSSGEESVMWYAYRMDESWYSKPLRLQLAYGARSLISAPLTSVIALRAACDGDCDGARRLLEEFTRAAWPDGMSP